MKLIAGIFLNMLKLYPPLMIPSLEGPSKRSREVTYTLLNYTFAAVTRDSVNIFLLNRKSVNSEAGISGPQCFILLLPNPTTLIGGNSYFIGSC
jgi:hypothetical protein